MKHIIYTAIATLLLGIFSCNKMEDIAYPKIKTEFAISDISINESASVDIPINLSRKADYDISITITLELNELVYGTHFTTNPEIINNTVELSIPAGTTSALFTLTKNKDAIFSGSETIKFAITNISQTEDLLIGKKQEATLSFGAIISEGQERLVLNGKTEDSNYANLVYVDFSTNTPTPISRKSWHLGFYMGQEFNVILSTGNSVVAVPSGKTDINAVSLTDAEICAINLGANGMSETIPTTAIDNPNGVLSGTVFKVSENDAENLVYFVAGTDDKTGRNLWYKVKVNRSNQAYSVQYARVDQSEIKTVNIEKNPEYNILELNLAQNEILKAEPKAHKWDIMWGYNTSISAMGATKVVGFSQDNVLINNLGGVKAAKVLTENIEYNNLTTSDLGSLDFSDNRSFIGTGWRAVAAPGVTNPGVINTHYYVIKDAQGNYYKLKFLRFGVNNDGAERGRPEIQFTLIK